MAVIQKHTWELRMILLLYKYKVQGIIDNNIYNYITTILILITIINNKYKYILYYILCYIINNNYTSIVNIIVM